LTIGSRMNIRLIGHNTASFARAAFKAMVDIDPAEMHKPTLKIDLPIHADARDFIEELDHQLEGVSLPDRKAWLAWCRQCQEVLPSIHQDNPLQPGYVDQFQFIETLFDLLEPGSIVVSGNGTTFVSVHMAGGIKEGVRVISNQGGSIMGYDLPAVIGAAIACPGKPVILVTGDGSIQMNIQEMATIQGYQLPVKLFLINNEGYLSIRNTQKSFFSGMRVGCDAESGLYLPDIMEIARVYGFPLVEIRENSQLAEEIRSVLTQPGAVFCQLKMSHTQTMYPRQSSRILADGKIESVPLEDMYPFIDQRIHDHLIATLPH
ncbi:MAG TPA: thiamine pyrophosphate-dependent enzyme, partial [Anaerolineaceae bacterium]